MRWGCGQGGCYRPLLMVEGFGGVGNELKSGKGKGKPNSKLGLNQVTRARQIDMSAILYPWPKISNKFKAIEYSGGTGATPG